MSDGWSAKKPAAAFASVLDEMFSFTFTLGACCTYDANGVFRQTGVETVEKIKRSVAIIVKPHKTPVVVWHRTPGVRTRVRFRTQTGDPGRTTCKRSANLHLAPAASSPLCPPKDLCRPRKTIPEGVSGKYNQMVGWAPRHPSRPRAAEHPERIFPKDFQSGRFRQTHFSAALTGGEA